MDEDWRNAFGVLLCAEICDGDGAGICNGAPSTCSSFFLIFPENMFSHFMQIVSTGDNLHEMSNPLPGEK